MRRANRSRRFSYSLFPPQVEPFGTRSGSTWRVTTTPSFIDLQFTPITLHSTTPLNMLFSQHLPRPRNLKRLTRQRNRHKACWLRLRAIVPLVHSSALNNVVLNSSARTLPYPPFSTPKHPFKNVRKQYSPQASNPPSPHHQVPCAHVQSHKYCSRC